jgi:hypothetical protein
MKSEVGSWQVKNLPHGLEEFFDFTLESIGKRSL